MLLWPWSKIGKSCPLTNTLRTNHNSVFTTVTAEEKINLIYVNMVQVFKIYQEGFAIAAMSIWNLLVPKDPCKRTQHCWPRTRNIVGSNMLRPFACNHNNIGTCWHLLRIVWKRSNFCATSPNISIVLWPPKRSGTMLRPSHNNVALVKTSAHAHCKDYCTRMHHVFRRH